VGVYGGVAVLCWPVLITGLALTDGRRTRFLAQDAMVYGGRVSYCLYLTHALVKDIGLGVIWHDASAAGARAPGVVLLVPALVVVSFLGAAALHHGVEEPARRRLVRLWSGRRAVQTAPTARRPPSTAVPTPTGEAATARWPSPLPGASARPWPLHAPPRPRTAAPAGIPASARLAAGDGWAARPRG
jgi:hypothetical protein